LKQRGHILDPGSIPGSSTIGTLFSKTGLGYMPIRQCIFDGAEMGSTGVKVEVEFTG